MPLSGFHPVIERWFGARFAEPTEPQRGAWPVIHAGRNALIAAPTGSGKTFAAFLAAIDSLLRQGLDGALRDETQVVYVSPLKALSNDVQKNLAEPLAEIRRTLEAMCLPDVEIRTLVRTGDTPAADRQAMVKRPPHILVTTPESLYLILTSERARDMLRTVPTVIVDEIHAVARAQRGSHLAPLRAHRGGARDGAPRQLVKGEAARRRDAAQGGQAQGAGGDGIARARDRHRHGGPGVPDWLDSLDRDAAAARGAGGTSPAGGPEGTAVPAVARRADRVRRPRTGDRGAPARPAGHPPPPARHPRPAK